MMISLRTRILPLMAITLSASALPGWAGDSLHQVCVGQINVGASAAIPNAKGIEKLAMVYSDQREGSFKRKITVSMIRGVDTTYVGEDTLSAGAQKANIVLRNVDDANDVAFKGTVENLGEYAGIRIDGEYITGDKKSHPVHLKLVGYNIPQEPIASASKTAQ